MTKQMPTFFPAKLIGARRETPFSFHLRFEMENERAGKSFVTPGQYAVIRVPNAKEGFFAMSNAPMEADWSFLVKKETPLTNRLAEIKPGTTVEISSAQGKGFDMELCRGKNILLFAAGTGIAPLRSALLWMMKRRKNYLAITLFTGARNADEFAYAGEFSSWEKSGVEIVQTISNRKDSSWQGLFGHVQRHIAATLKSKNTVALICGMEKMIEETIRRLASLGLPQKNILTNY